jgi:hypothetical protein
VHLFGCNPQVMRASESIEQLKMSEAQPRQHAGRMQLKVWRHGVYAQKLITEWNRFYLIRDWMFIGWLRKVSNQAGRPWTFGVRALMTNLADRGLPGTATL